MNIASKLYCRIFQGAFRAALPVLPYREPKIINARTDLKGVFEKKNKQHERNDSYEDKNYCRLYCRSHARI